MKVAKVYVEDADAVPQAIDWEDADQMKTEATELALMRLDQMTTGRTRFDQLKV